MFTYLYVFHELSYILYIWTYLHIHINTCKFDKYAYVYGRVFRIRWCVYTCTYLYVWVHAGGGVREWVVGGWQGGWVGVH